MKLAHLALAAAALALGACAPARAEPAKARVETGDPPGRGAGLDHRDRRPRR